MGCTVDLVIFQGRDHGLLFVFYVLTFHLKILPLFSSKRKDTPLQLSHRAGNDDPHQMLEDIQPLSFTV